MTVRDVYGKDKYFVRRVAINVSSPTLIEKPGAYIINAESTRFLLI